MQDAQVICTVYTYDIGIDRHQQASGMLGKTTWDLVWTALLGTLLKNAVR